MYQFNEGVPQSDRDFFGKNEGMPMRRPESSGMLKGGHNILEMPCKEVNRSVPYFEEVKKEQGSPNEIIFQIVDKLTEVDLDLNDKSNVIENLEKVPDGVITID